MNAGFILAVGMILAAGLAIVIAVARRAGTGAEDASTRYGRELEPQVRWGGRPDWTPERRRRARIAILAAALASIGAGMASFLATAAKH